jgi:hypothetical protein
MMSKKITNTELEQFIKDDIKSKALGNDITLQKFNEIKEKITSALKTHSESVQQPTESTETLTEQIPPSSVPENDIMERGVQQPEPSTITQTTTVSQDAVSTAEKEGELTQKEKDLNQKEQELQAKEAELNQKAESLKYTPQIPEILNNVGSEELFVFSEDELSFSAENLSSQKFRKMSNPDDKVSMMELWGTEGKRKSLISLVKLIPIGNIEFNVLQGTSYFEKMPYQNGENPEPVPVDPNIGLTASEARESQILPNIDSIEPVANTTLPLDTTGDALKMINSEDVEKDRIYKYLNDYFKDKFPHV